MSLKKRPEDQSNEEWLADYEGHEPFSDEAKSTASSRDGTSPGNVPIVCINSNLREPQTSTSDISTRLLTLENFKTTTDESLLLHFRDVETQQRVVMYCNVALNSQRGDKTQKHEAGIRKYFYPPEEGKFREWWLLAVGKKPKRWGNVWRELLPRLRGKTFEAEVFIAYQRPNKHGKSAPYLKVEGLPRPVQGRDNSGTKL